MQKLEVGKSLFGSDSLLVTALISGSLIFVVFLQTKPQFSRISIVAFFADWFQINFIEFGVDGHLLVAGEQAKWLTHQALLSAVNTSP